MSMTCRSRRDSAGVSGCFFIEETVDKSSAEKSTMLIFQPTGEIVKGNIGSQFSVFGHQPASGRRRGA
jgi:hypothetical protein